MIVEYIRYETADGDALVRAYEVAAASLRASSHCLGFELSRCAEAPGQLILRIEWDSAEGHMKGFRGSPEFRPFFQAIQPFVKDIREMRHYEPTGVGWTRDA